MKFSPQFSPIVLMSTGALVLSLTLGTGARADISNSTKPAFSAHATASSSGLIVVADKGGSSDKGNQGKGNEGNNGNENGGDEGMQGCGNSGKPGCPPKQCPPGHGDTNPAGHQDCKKEKSGD